MKEIAALNEEDFRELVDRDLRRENTEEEALALRSPALVDRWHTVLVSMSKSVDGQLSAKRQDFEAHKARLKSQLLRADEELGLARADHDRDRIADVEKRARKLREEWAAAQERYSRSRAATLRFKSGLEETLVEARLHRDKTRDRLYDTVVSQERNRLATRVRRYESALQTIAAWNGDAEPAGVARRALAEEDE